MFKLFMKKNNKKGFTLVELMVVVAIIGVLVAIAVPVYNSSQTKAQENACLANIRTIDSAIEMFKANNNGTAPADLAALVGTDRYIKTTPVCPAGGAAYTIGDNKAAHFDADGKHKAAAAGDGD